MRHHLLTPVLALPAVAALVIGLPTAGASSEVPEFEVDLQPVNAEGARGKVEIEHHGTALAVELRARDLDDGVHIAHIHGVRQAENECPALTADTNRDGRVDLVEGLPSYGPVQLTLSNGTNDRGTRIRYERVYAQLDNGDPVAALGDLTRYAVVVHGVDLDGDGLATNPNVGGDATTDHDDNEVSMPALCGTIEHDD